MRLPGGNLDLGVQLAAHDLAAVHGRVFPAGEQVALPRDRERFWRSLLRRHSRRESNAERKRDAQRTESSDCPVHATRPDSDEARSLSKMIMSWLFGAS